jgi:hypothetical protein
MAEMVEMASRIKGCSGLEVVYPQNFTDPAKVKGLLDDHGLSVSTVNLNIKSDDIFRYGSFSSPDAKVRRKAVEMLKYSMDAAATLGCNMVTTAPLCDGSDYPFELDYIRAFEDAADAIGEAAGHRGDVKVSLEYKLSEPRVHCLLSNAAEIAGAVQYVVPIVNAEDETVHALIFMDSLGRDPETNFLTYDCMKKNQADWLRAQLQALKAEAPLAKASVFFHANTPAFSTAQKDGEPYAESETYYAMIAFPDSWAIRGNEIVDKAIAAEGNAGLVSIGHLHPAKNACAFLNGTYYHITRASGYQATSRPGAAVITIHTYDGSPRRLYDFKEIIF